jgi:serine/threonine-protein kinase
MNAWETGSEWTARIPVGYRVGDWEVTEPIASGNFGRVYAARRVECGDEASKVALKFMATRAMAPRQFHEVQKLAQREVDFCRDASHERLIRVDSSIVVEDADAELDGAVVLVMERAEKSLQDLLDEATSIAALPRARQLIVEICEGLEYLHSSGWVHGDLKPSNILLMPDGSVRLADFGLATRLDGTHGYGPPFGSMDYLPPERWNDRLGEHGVPVRQSADVWALGVTAHQILTGGQFPIPGSTASARAVAAQDLAAGRTKLRLHSDVDEDWREFIGLCLAPDHTGRPAASDLLDRARKLPEPQPSTAHRRWARPLVFALVAAGLAAAAGGAWWSRPDPPKTVHAGTVELTVYNVEAACRENQERLRSCSLGLALDPYLPYEPANVSQHRVWHGDKLIAKCVLHEATYVADENGVSSRSWYKVAVEIEPVGFVWLPAVRTRDDLNALAACQGSPRGPLLSSASPASPMAASTH